MAQRVQELRSDDPAVRLQAAKALVESSNAGAVQPLFDALKDAVRKDDSTLVYFLEAALKAVQDPAAIDKLIPYLQDDERFMLVAAESLSKFPDARAVDAIFATRAKGKREGSGMHLKVLWTLENFMRDKISGPHARELLLEQLKQGDRVAAAALRRFPGTEVSDALIAALDHEKAEMRSEAAYSLSQLKEPRAVPALGRLLSDSDKAVRQNAAVALGETGDRRAVAPLVARLGREQEESVLGSLAEALGKLRDPSALPALNAALLPHESWARTEMLRAIGILKSIPTNVPDTRSLVSNPPNGATGVDPSIREITITFPEEMRTDGFNVVPIRGLAMPEAAGDEPFSFRSSRTFVMQVKLLPETEYAIGLNSERWKGFKHADGTPLRPTVLRFATGKAGAVRPAPQPVAGNELFVTQQPRGFRASEFRTIGEAIRNARAGTTIHVYPGTYTETVVLDRPVTLVRAAGETGEVIVEARAGNCVAMKTTLATIRGFVLRCKAGEAGIKAFAVDIGGGKLTLEDCDITSDSLACVAIHGPDADPVLRGCKIHDGATGGLFVFDRGRGTVEKCEIYGNALAGIEITGQGNPSIRHSKIHSGKQGGVYALAQGAGTLEDCEIYSNKYAGVQIRSGATTTLRRCKIHDGEQSGVYVNEQGEGLIEACEIYANTLAGIEITTGGKPVVKQTILRDGKQGGVYVQKQGAGTFEDCEIYGNSWCGVAITSEGNPTFRRCTFRDGKQSGAFVYDGGRGVFEECTFSGNALAGIESKNGGNPTLQDCKFLDGKQGGVLVNGKGEGLFERCEIAGNTLAGVEIRAEAIPTLRGCTIKNNMAEGIVARPEAGGTVERCEIFGNQKDLVELPGSELTLRDNRLGGGDGAANRVVPVPAPVPEREIVARIEAAGGSVSIDPEGGGQVRVNLSGVRAVDAPLIAMVAKLRGLTALHLGDSTVTDVALAPLKDARTLQELVLSRTAITDLGLVQFRGLHRLEVLDLEDTTVGDAGMESLKGLDGLLSLRLSGSRVGDDGLEALKSLATLEKLYLNGLEITDKGLTRLGELALLEELNLVGTRVTADGLPALKHLPRLRKLDLSFTAVDDAGLERLGGLRSLVDLSLVETPITDAGLPNLRTLVRLRRLDLGLTRVSAAAVARLQKELPDVSILHSPPVEKDVTAINVTSLVPLLTAVLGEAQESPRIAYPEGTAGLRQLAEDLLASSRAGEADRLAVLVRSLVLPDHERWFKRVFGEEAGAKVAAEYGKDAASMQEYLVGTLKTLVQRGQTEVRVLRFDRPNEEATGLQSRALGVMRERVALYSVRFVRPGEESGMHLWSFVYAGGTFRVVGKMRALETAPAAEARPAPAARGEVPRVLYSNPIAGFALEIPGDWEMATGAAGNIEIAIDAETGARLWGQPALWFFYAPQPPVRQASNLAGALRILGGREVDVRQNTGREWEVRAVFDAPVLGELNGRWLCREERGMSYVIGVAVRSALESRFQGDIETALRTCRLIEHPVLQYFHEPTERAYRILLPEGWRWEGAILRTREVPGFFTWKASSTDGTTACFTGPPATFNMFQDYVPADRLASGIVLDGMRTLVGDARLESVTPLPRATEYTREAARLLGLHGRFDKVRADYLGLVNGVRIRARVDITTWMPQVSTFPDERIRGRGDWFAFASGAWAPESRFDDLFPIARGVQDSHRTSPEWIRRQRETVGKVLAGRDSVLDEACKGWDAYIRDMERIPDPDGGPIQEVPNRDGGVWKDPSGKMWRVTRDADIEQALRNRGWKPIR